MNRKRAQADKSVHAEETEETPAKRSRRANQAQNKENALNPNIPSDAFSQIAQNVAMEEIAQSSQRTIVLRNMQAEAGTALKSGRIKKIILKNFMCHRNFEVTLNPNVNVFVGLNGSGKSAILTAIAIGLGSKAQATARSTNLKDLVRRGETSATIEITLSNDGVDAYDDAVYGREIVVVRTINGNTGSSQYKIKGEGGRKVISTSRQDLSRLTLCMNIQVENPVLILNQDAARSFLKDSDPKKLFQFFMKATQIEAIIDKLNSTLKIALTLKNNLELMDKRMKQDEAEVQDLEAKLTRLQSVQALRQFIKKLHNEIEWIRIIAREKELLKAQNVLSKTRTDLNKIDDYLNGQADFEKRIKELICQLGTSFGHLQKELEKNAAQYEKARDEHEIEYGKEKESEGKINMLKKRLGNIMKNIQDIEQDIAEYESNPDNVNNMRQENEAKMEDFTNKRGEAVKILENAKRDHGMFIDNLNVSKEKLSAISARMQREQNQLQKLTGQIENFRRAGKDQMMAYGPSMSSLLRDIEQLTRQGKFSAAPRGPIGRYIEVTDRKYRLAAENILDRTLSAFIVNSDQDRMTLKRALGRYNDLRNCSIICCKFRNQVYDVRTGTVDINQNIGVSLFEVLKVSDPIVMNCLIDQKMIERIVLVDQTDKAINLTQNERNVPRNLLKVVLLEPFSEYYPAPNYRTYSLRQQPARFIQANNEELIEGIQEQVQSVQAKIASMKGDAGQIQQQVREQEKLVNDKKKIMTEVHRRIASYDRELEELRSIEYPEEGNIEFKRGLLEEEEEKRAAFQKKIDEMSNKQKVLKEISENFKKKVDEAQEEHQKTREKMAHAQSTIEKSQIELNEMKLNITSKKNQLQNLKAEETLKAAEVATLQTEVQALMEKATGNRVECNRPEDEIKAQIKSIEKKIERIESSNENIDDIAQLLEDKKSAKNKMQTMTDGLKRLQLKMNQMRDGRFQYVRRLRQSMANRVRQKFSTLMELRNYMAEMNLDTAAKSLELKVIPRDGEIEGAVSNTKSLSGGERSYSTVSFLIALWTSVDHPFYFLDEYDVFSDEYNRHIMTQLLFNEAKKHPEKQYGFLTPQDFSNIQASETITLHKLQDPGRKQ